MLNELNKNFEETLISEADWKKLENLLMALGIGYSISFQTYGESILMNSTINPIIIERANLLKTTTESIKEEYVPVSEVSLEGILTTATSI